MPNSRKEYHAQRWKDHGEKMKARQADWRKENREKKRAQDKEYQRLRRLEQKQNKGDNNE